MASEPKFDPEKLVGLLQQEENDLEKWDNSRADVDAAKWANHLSWFLKQINEQCTVLDGELAEEVATNGSRTASIRNRLLALTKKRDEIQADLQSAYNAITQVGNKLSDEGELPDVTDLRPRRRRSAKSVVDELAQRAKAKAREIDQPPANTTTPSIPEQLDLFNADLILDYSLRDEINGMSIPMYALAKIPSRGVWRWDSPDGKHYVEITSQFLAEQLDDDGSTRPGEIAPGRATIFDKDIIIYSISKLNEAMERHMTVGPTIRFTAYDFFAATKRDPGGNDYKNMVDSLRRLRSTNVETNVIGSDGTTTRISGIINDAEVKRGTRGELQYIELTLANWLFSAVRNHRVLAINPEYFELSRPIERVLYSIARKHVGRQGMWKISLENLKIKCGAAPNSPLRNFLADVRRVIDDDKLPDYRLSISPRSEGHMVTFYSRDTKTVAKKAAIKKLSSQ